MPSVSLTARFLESVKPQPSARVEYFDDHTPGLALRVSESGVKTWVLLYRTQPNAETQQVPRLRRLTLGRYPDLDLKAARKQAQIDRGAIAKGKDPAAVKQALRRAAGRGDTIADLAKDYLAKYAKLHKRSWKEDDRMLEAEVLPAWRHRKVKSLTRRDVRELIEGIAERSPIAANRYLALVRKMLNWAISKDWLEGNPAALMEKPGAERSRDRVLTNDELRLVWVACEAERPAMCALTRLRLMTAQRGGELSQIRWSDVEGSWMTIPGSVTKNKQPHRVPLTKAAKALIDTLPQIQDCEYVFPGGRGDNRPCSDHKKAAQRIATRVLETLQETDSAVDVFDFRGHDLRRTAATKMAEAGVGQSDIAKLLNHAEGGPRATQVYNRYAYDREKRTAMETWGRTLTRILQQKGAGKVVPIRASR